MSMLVSKFARLYADPSVKNQHYSVRVGESGAVNIRFRKTGHILHLSCFGKLNEGFGDCTKEELATIANRFMRADAECQINLDFSDDFQNIHEGLWSQIDRKVNDHLVFKTRCIEVYDPDGFCNWAETYVPEDVENLITRKQDILTKEDIIAMRGYVSAAEKVASVLNKIRTAMDDAEAFAKPDPLLYYYKYRALEPQFWA